MSHLIVWTLIPALTNTNLPLDTIEALAWSSKLEWGYYKHPPFSALVVGVVYFIFGSYDWIYYLLSQILVTIAFIYVWKLSLEFFDDKVFSLLSILILESIVFFNYTTPEFNVYVCQLPLKAMLVYFFWKGLEKNYKKYWILIGIVSACGTLTHYSFLFLIFGLLIYFIFLFKNKTNAYLKNFFLSFLVFFIICFPHLIWLLENNFSTIYYAFGRSGVNDKSFIDHFYNPIKFLLKQIGMLLPFFIIFFYICSFKKKLRFTKINQKKFFLLSVSLIPLLIVLAVSIITGAKIRTMWMSSFYLFNGLLLFYFFYKQINFKKLKTFYYLIIFIFFLSPLTYLIVSITNDDKRTDYQGKEIARLVQTKWDRNFSNEIKIVIGDEWSAGNLSYHLQSRPVWINDLKKLASNITSDQGVIYTGNPKVLKKICPGVYGTIKPVGYCMIGTK